MYYFRQYKRLRKRRYITRYNRYFKDFIINTKYSADSFRLQWQDDTNFKTAVIYDKENNSKIEEFKLEKNTIQPYLEGYTQKRFHNYKYFGPIQLDCAVLVNMYVWNSFRQINSVSSGVLRIKTYSSQTYLEYPQVDYYSKTGSFPTSSVGVNYATVCISVSSAASAGINLELMNAGYSVSSTQIYRNYAEGSYTISC